MITIAYLIRLMKRVLTSPYLYIVMPLIKKPADVRLYIQVLRRGLELAQKVHAKILPVFGNPDRGIKKRRLKDRGGWILHKTKMPCIILEPFFIDNDEELKKAKRVYKEYAKAIIDAL
jgi:N-acetylmuramoyl-L-alanine amidase